MPETQMRTFDESASGLYIISVTPFLDDGTLDLPGVDRLVDFYLSQNVSGIVVLSMMGEAQKLTPDETTQFVQRVCARVNGAVPVIVGLPGGGLVALKAVADIAVAAGASGVMVAPAPSLRSDRQIVEYFGSVADVLGDVPFVLQDFPLATGVQIPAEVMSRIIRSQPTLKAIKHEDWPGLNKITTLRDDDARQVSILVGNGSLYLPEELDRGANGAMTGFAFPDMIVEVCRLHAAGQREAAYDLFDVYLPLIRYEQQPGVGLSVRKYLMHKAGILASHRLRAPGRSLNAQEVAEVDWLVARQSRRIKR